MKKNYWYLLILLVMGITAYFVLTTNRNSTIADREDTAFAVKTPWPSTKSSSPR
jgi:hypothetical protein